MLGGGKESISCVGAAKAGRVEESSASLTPVSGAVVTCRIILCCLYLYSDMAKDKLEFRFRRNET